MKNQVFIALSPYVLVGMSSLPPPPPPTHAQYANGNCVLACSGFYILGYFSTKKCEAVIFTKFGLVCMTHQASQILGHC